MLENPEIIPELLDYLSMGVFYADLDGNCVYVNKEWLNISGLTKEESLGKGWYKSIHKDDVPEVIREGILLRTQYKPIDMIYRIVRPNGELKYVNAKSKVIFDKDGNAKFFIGSIFDITEQKDLANELKKTEYSLNSIINSINDIIFELDSKYIFTNVWVKEESSLFVPKEMLLGKTIEQALGKDFYNKFKKSLDSVLKTGVPQNVEYSSILKDDNRWFNARISRLEDKVLKYQKIFISVQDITKIRKAEDNLKDTKNYLELLLKATTDGFCELDLISNKIEYSKRFATMLGYKLEELPDNFELLDKIFLSDDFQKCKENIRVLTSNEKSEIAFESNFIKKDTSVLNVLTRALVVKDEKNKPIKVIMAHTDISNLKEKEKQILKQKEFMRKVLDAIPNHIAIQDSKRKFILTNKYFAHYFNKNVEDIENASPYKIQFFENNRSILIDMNSELTALNQTVSRELKKVNPDGSVIWFNVLKTLIEGDNGEVNILSVANNITELKNKELELVKAKETAEKANKAKSDFLSMMSHEIRTPLNAIIGMTNILIDENTSEAQKENLQTLKFSSENLLFIINDILDFNKIEAGKIDFEETSFYLLDILKNIKNVYVNQVKERNTSLLLDIDPEITFNIISDPLRLTQIINNLVSNAIKFTFNGLIKISVVLKSKTEDYVELSFFVSDTGIGIAEDKQEQVFESFVQANSQTTRKYGGTGLGLAITKKLVELMGGNIKIESKLDKGTIFSFSLKFKYKFVIESNTLVDDNVFEKNLDLSTINLLMVEDNKINILVATRFLKKWGINFDIAENGLSALEKFKEKSYDVILMDLQMPEMDGYATTIEIRKKNKSIPIIALTASATVEDKSRTNEVGMNDFITKPFNPDELKLKIMKQLQK